MVHSYGQRNSSHVLTYCIIIMMLRREKYYTVSVMPCNLVEVNMYQTTRRHSDCRDSLRRVRTTDYLLSVLQDILGEPTTSMASRCCPWYLLRRLYATPECQRSCLMSTANTEFRRGLTLFEGFSACHNDKRIIKGHDDGV
jgi:hypothetical protein